MLNTLKKRLILLSIIILCVGTAVATTSYSPSVQGYCHSSFTFPTAEYLTTSQGRALPKMRTSFDVGADAMVANFSIGRSEVGAGFSWLYNSRSIAAGNNFLRSYSGMGFAVGYQYHFKRIFSMGGKFRYLFCSYRPLKSRFDIAEIEAVPAFDFIKNNVFETSVSIPVTASLKADSVSLRVGVGFDVQFNVCLGGKHEKN